MEIWEVFGNRTAQPLLASINKSLCVVLAPLIFSFVNCLKEHTSQHHVQGKHLKLNAKYAYT